ncbi:Male sterility NAD-binding [Penicillium concentricum]|uniref:Male sterility NAD-binding n=1 Tax=Penicillium concentricum TaxID=293559 RepID=A0A9W9SS62_9EURO|nr:Male sterility NAD-binding [Penicillium concentricum]KAJ5383145.1 Male sterility NAD-binding [Penicillium concentricum]
MSPSLLCARKLDAILVRHVGLAPLFKAQARLLGPVIAIESGKHAVSYKELHFKALQLAQLIRLEAPELRTPIAIAIPRGVNHILAQIAIAYAGGTCVPLDTKQPDVFLRKLLRNLDVKLALVDARNWGRSLEIDNILVDHTLSPVISDEEFEVSSNGPSSCSHILHTSGTTGYPKAAQILAGGLINLAFSSIAPFQDGQRLAHIGNTVFDVTLFEIWVCLLRGGTLVIYPHETVIDPVLFSRSLREDRIEAVFVTTALLNTIVSTCPGAFSTIHTLATGGEPINVPVIRKIFDNGPPERVVHIYGPTECTVFLIAHDVTAANIHNGQIPLGRPVNNCQVFIVDENLIPVPTGSEGELVVAGAAVSAGYCRNPLANAKSFINPPHLPLKGLAMGFPCHVYRTGDIERMDESGLYYFVGRRDRQVKIRGHRIELEGLENIILGTNLASAAAVVKIEPKDANAEPILVAYVVPECIHINREAVTRAFINHAPHLPVPRVEFISELPLGTTGKCNRKKLEELYVEKMRVARESQLHSDGNANSVEARLEQLWLEILGYPLDRLSSSDDFFHLGGTSLQVAYLIGRIRLLLGIELRSAALYENSTLSQLTQLVQKLKDGPALSNAAEEQSVLARDSFLGQNLRVSLDPTVDWLDASEGRVFLTGATGFVGAFLLATMLSMPQVTQVACLVRAQDTSAADLRIKRTLEKYKLRGFQERKIIPITGDLSLPHLGLPQEQYDHYASWASVVFHLGALVSYVQPYSRHRAANVLGTLELLRFANHSRPKRLIYSSSIAAYGPTGFVQGTKTIPEDEAPLGHITALQYDTGYSQSQFVAENVVWNAIRNGSPAIIIRLGYVLGHSQTGRGNPSDFIGCLMSSCLQLGHYPIVSGQRKAFASVDFVVYAMLRIAAFEENVGHAYNLIQPEPIDLQEAFDLISEQCPRPLKGISFPRWLDMFVDDATNPLHPFLPLFQEEIWGSHTRWGVQESAPWFEINNTLRALRDSPELLAWMPALDLLRKYIPGWSAASSNL